MTSPSVSILMPVFKTAPFLREAVDSILAQTYNDFELIVLNDCSPDNAEDILDTYNDPRIIRYRGEKNQGLANVLNIGIAMARGKYIARMDSDDISLPSRLKKQVNFLDSHPDIDLCSCGMELFGAKSGRWIRESNPEKVKITALFFSPILHASSVWRRQSFEKHNLHFDQSMVPAEDYDLWCRTLVKGLKLVNLPDVLYQYRIRPEQATSNTDKTFNKSIEVRHHFLHSIFPSANDTSIDKFATLCNETNPDIFLATKKELESINQKEKFFDRNLLKKQLDKSYQAILLKHLKTQYSLKNFCKLSFKNKIRFIGINHWLFSNWTRIDKHATFSLRKKNLNKCGFSAIALHGTHTDLHPSSSLIVNNGRFTLNNKWSFDDPFPSLFVMREKGYLIVNNSFDIYSGAKIYINKNASLELGGGYINHNLNLSCFEKISIGNDVVISENVTIRDNDDHEIIGRDKPMTMPITIGNHVWIGMNVTILKGVTIGDGAIIAAGSIVNKDIPSHCLAAGVPARIIKTDVAWK